MTITNMSLHRVIAEIKSLEQNLGMLTQHVYVTAQVGDDAAKTLELKAASQAAFDKVRSQYTNLASLKAARNKANSVTSVVIGGVTMTVDQALAAKAAIGYKSGLVNTLTAQFTVAQRAVDINVAQIEAKVAQQMATMFTGTRKATDDEVAVIRAAAERNQKAQLVFAAGLKEQLETLKKEIEAFTLEVDFVLSEANATTKVDVDMV